MSRTKHHTRETSRRVAIALGAWIACLPAACFPFADGRATLPLSGPPVLAVAAELGPDEAVRAGRDGLDEGWVRSQYPWYDADSDGLRSVAAPDPVFWTWLANVFSSIRDWLQKFNFSFNLPFFNVSVSLFQLLGVLALLGLVALLVFVLSKLYRKQQARRVGNVALDSAADERTDADRIEALPMPVDRGPRDLLEWAEMSYRRGDYGEAIKYLFSHQLVELDKNHLVRLAKGKTNRQYLHELSPSSALARLVERTMVAFEDAFFGNHALERSRFETCWFALDQFRQLVQQGAG